jgi:hypothetical protein
MEVMIFKTNVNSKRKADKIGTSLKSAPNIKQWNFDLEDCDYILRIVATGVKPDWVEAVLQKAGFMCQVLPY